MRSGSTVSTSQSSVSSRLLSTTLTADKIQLFWTRSHSGLLRKLVPNIIREVCAYIGSLPRPIAILTDSIRVYDVPSNVWKFHCNFDNEVRVNDSSSSTFIGTNTLFVCGGGRIYEDSGNFHTGRFAYIFDGEGTVRRLPHMRLPRSYPGLYYSWAGSVFVFGGMYWYEDCKETMKTAEKFELSTSRWQNLPEMTTERWGFNPCAYGQLVYLCGGNCPSVETYNIRSNTFTLFPDFILPEKSSSSISVIDSDSLVVLTKGYICRWSLELGQLLLSQKHVEYKEYCLSSRCTPGVHDGKIYAVMGKVCKVINAMNGVTEKKLLIKLV